MGRSRAEVVHFNPTTEEDVESFKGKLTGKIVLMGTAREVKARFEPLGTRYTESELLELANAPNPLEPREGGERRRGYPAQRRRAEEVWPYDERWVSY